MKKMIAFLGLCLTVGSVSAAPLSNDDWHEIRGITENACITNQAKIPENGDLTVRQLKQYCQCVGKTVAREYSAEDFAHYKETGSSDRLLLVSGSAYKECAP